MTCVRCGTRKGRRQCPALRGALCAACCGSQRLVSIPCPTTCGWLLAAEAHPAAARQRQQADDQARLHPLLYGIEHGAYMALTVCADEALRFRAGAVPVPTDDDLLQAVGALAATHETAARGVIYEHQPDTIVAARLARTLSQSLARAAEGAPALQDAAEVASGLRRLEQAIRLMRRDHADAPSAFLDFLARVLRPAAGEAAAGEALAARALADLAQTEPAPPLPAQPVPAPPDSTLPTGSRLLLP